MKNMAHCRHDRDQTKKHNYFVNINSALCQRKKYNYNFVQFLLRIFERSLYLFFLKSKNNPEKWKREREREKSHKKWNILLKIGINSCYLVANLMWCAFADMTIFNITIIVICAMTVVIITIPDVNVLPTPEHYLALYYHYYYAAYCCYCCCWCSVSDNRIVLGARACSLSTPLYLSLSPHICDVYMAIEY